METQLGQQLERIDPKRKYGRLCIYLVSPSIRYVWFADQSIHKCIEIQELKKEQETQKQRVALIQSDGKSAKQKVNTF